LERAAARPVDAIVLDRASPLVAREAARGIPILSRDPYAELEWVLAVEREAEDWRAFLSSFLDERARSPRGGAAAMRLTAVQALAVRARTEFVRSELADLGAHRDMDWTAYQEDRSRRRNVERIAENVANAAVDIAKILLAAAGGPVPATYREVVLATAPAGLADEVMAAELARLAQLRNALSHRYLDYRWDALKWFLRSGCTAVEAWIEACDRWVADHGPGAEAAREGADPPGQPGVGP
jgi:uncharacterized protein YutE (UPF0331/DUF86 family)